MDGSTHFPIGLLAGLEVASKFPLLQASLPYAYPGGLFLLAGAAAVASLLPDIDHPKSRLGRFVPLPSAERFNGPNAPPKVGRRIPFTGIVIWHRGPTHSLLAAAIVFVGIWLAFVGHGYAFPVALMALVGYLSHLAVDLFNYTPEWLFWPFVGGKRGKWVLPWPKMQAGGAGDHVIGAMASLGVLLVVAGRLTPVLSHFGASKP
ncbi:MAG: metal-dependent hydrolase [Candidatus Igneacidithiobacillus chanchocoensis]